MLFWMKWISEWGNMSLLQKFLPSKNLTSYIDYCYYIHGRLADFHIVDVHKHRNTPPERNARDGSSRVRHYYVVRKLVSMKIYSRHRAALHMVAVHCGRRTINCISRQKRSNFFLSLSFFWLACFVRSNGGAAGRGKQ